MCSAIEKEKNQQRRMALYSARPSNSNSPFDGINQDNTITETRQSVRDLGIGWTMAIRKRAAARAA